MTNYAELRRREQDLIRVRGQSIMYALNDVSKGFQQWEVLTDERKPHNPRSAGAMVPEVRLEVQADLSLRARYAGAKHNPDVQLSTPTIEKPSAVSHLTVWVPDERVGDTEEVGIFEHCVILTPARLELAEALLEQRGFTVWQAYQSYVHGNALQVFKVENSYIRAASYGCESRFPGLRRAVETIGRCFLQDHSPEEAEIDARRR